MVGIASGASATVNNAEDGGVAQSINITAFDTVTGNFTADQSISIFTWKTIDNLTAATISETSNIDLFAHDGIDNTTVTSANYLTVSSLDNINGAFTAGTHAQAQYGNADISSFASIDATISAAGTANVYAGGFDQSHNANGNINGSIGAGTVTATATNNVNAEINATGDASVTALDGSIQYTITAGGSVTAFSKGDIDTLADIAAGVDASVSSFGFIHADVTATLGDLNLSAFDNITGVYSAGNNANIFVGGSTAFINAGGDLSFFSETGASGSYSAGNNAYISALYGVSADINAGVDASVFSFGAVSGLISASTGDAAVSSGDVMTAGITAGHDVYVSGMDDVAGTMTAGNQIVATSIEDLTSLVDADGDVTLFALGDIGAITSAGGDLIVSAFGNITSTYESDGDASFSAMGFAAGVLNAGGNVDAFGWTGVFTNITAGGNASLSSLTFVGSVVSAGGSITADGFDGASVTASAGGDVSVTSAISASATVTSAQNVVASALDIVGVDLSGVSGDLSVFSGGAASVTGSIGGSAGIFAGSSLSGSLTAGDDVAAMSLGGFTLDIATSGSAFAFATGGMSGSTISAGGSAGVSVWDSITDLDLSVSGGGGASVFAYGSLNGSVVSTAGDVSVFAGGDVTLSSFGATGGGVASIQSLSSVTAAVNTAGNLSITAGGSIATTSSGIMASGNVTLGARVDIDTTAGSLTAGGDLTANAGGSVLASIVNAGHDVRLTAVDDISVSTSGGLTADHDIATLAAGRDLTGTYHARNAVTEARGYRLVNVDLSAGTNETDTGETTFGQIKLVESWGDIDGSIDAAESIASVTTAGAVMASSTAPGSTNTNEGDQQVVGDASLPLFTDPYSSPVSDPYIGHYWDAMNADWQYLGQQYMREDAQYGLVLDYTREQFSKSQTDIQEFREITANNVTITDDQIKAWIKEDIERTQAMLPTLVVVALNEKDIDTSHFKSHAEAAMADMVWFYTMSEEEFLQLIDSNAGIAAIAPYTKQMNLETAAGDHDSKIAQYREHKHLYYRQQAIEEVPLLAEPNLLQTPFNGPVIVNPRVFELTDEQRNGIDVFNGIHGAIPGRGFIWGSRAMKRFSEKHDYTDLVAWGMYNLGDSSERHQLKP